VAKLLEETSASVYGHLPSRHKIHTECSNLNQMLSTKPAMYELYDLEAISDQSNVERDYI